MSREETNALREHDFNNKTLGEYDEIGKMKV